MRKDRVKFSLIFGIFTMVTFFVLKSLILLGIVTVGAFTNIIELVCAIVFIPILYTIYNELLLKTKEFRVTQDYTGKLNNLLVEHSNNDSYYDGNINKVAKHLTKDVAYAMDVERVSVWLLNNDKDALVLQQLYMKSNNTYESGHVFKKSQYKPYFKYLLSKPVMVVDDVSTHPGTICLNSVNVPLGIKSILDVPIWYKGDIVGVISIESSEPRKWVNEEIDFAQVLTSLFSFTYSVHMNNLLTKEFFDFKDFVDKSLLVFRADPNGNITYVNKNFELVSGWKLKELYGLNYRKLTYESDDFWDDASKVIRQDGKVWKSLIKLKHKNGKSFWVDAYGMGRFDPENGQLIEGVDVWYDVTDMMENVQEIEQKNTYLEHAAKIIRHDMHSGINTYIPRGVSALERKLTPELIKKYKLENPLKLLKEGLKHTQKVYQGVYDFTNLVKKDVELVKTPLSLSKILRNFLFGMAYIDQVVIADLPTIPVNESLFCTAVDNLIRNGLKYNDSTTKQVTIYMENENTLVIRDNGRGMSQEDLINLSEPYKRKKDQKELGTGLGLNICMAILKEHGFAMTCEKIAEGGTKIKIKIK